MEPRKLPEVEKTMDDWFDKPSLCPECELPDIVPFDHKTTIGAQGMKFREYMICKSCYHVWQWVTRSELFSPNSDK